MGELKPCPFCRGECELRHEDLTDTPWGMMRNYWVECNRDRGEHSCLYRGAVGDTPSQASARHNALPREERWVPVSDGLPPRYALVWVTHEKTVYRAHYDDQDGCWYTDNGMRVQPTYWSPIIPPRGPEAIDD